MHPLFSASSGEDSSSAASSSASAFASPFRAQSVSPLPLRRMDSTSPGIGALSPSFAATLSPEISALSFPAGFAQAGFASAGNGALFPHLNGDAWLSSKDAGLDADLFAGIDLQSHSSLHSLGSDSRPQSSRPLMHSSPLPPTPVRSNGADPYASVGLGLLPALPTLHSSPASPNPYALPRSPAPYMGFARDFESLRQSPNETARDMSVSQRNDADADDTNPLDAEERSWEEEDDSGPAENQAMAAQQEDMEPEMDEEEEEEVAPRKRKHSAVKPGAAAAVQAAFLPSTVALGELPSAAAIPSNARVCELGFMALQTTGHLCWTSYQKVSATDRSCLALLCAAHSAAAEESKSSKLSSPIKSEDAVSLVATAKYTQLVAQDCLLQLGLGIDRKPLEQLLLQLQASGTIEPRTLLLRIRRAVPGRLKTGPDFCQLLLFPSAASRQAAQTALAAYVSPPAERIQYPSRAVPFTCDFTRRCVWLVPKQLCVGGQWMIPSSAGSLQTPTTTPVKPTSAAARSSSSRKYRSASSNAASPAASTQLPSFSNLSLHASPALEDASYLRALASLHSSESASSLAAASSGSAALSDFNRTSIARFRLFPARELIFTNDQAIDVSISRAAFLEHAMVLLLDKSNAGSDTDRKAEQSRWATLLASLFSIATLPAVAASSISFSRFARLRSWLQPDRDSSKPDGQVFHLLSFMHRSLKFFQSHSRKADRDVFASREQATAILHAQSSAAASASAASAAAAASSASDRAVIRASLLRFSDGFPGGDPARQIILSYATGGARDSEIMHVPLLKAVTSGVFVLTATGDLSDSLNFLSSTLKANDATLHAYARYTHETRPRRDVVKMEGSDEAEEENENEDL